MDVRLGAAGIGLWGWRSIIRGLGFGIWSRVWGIDASFLFSPIVLISFICIISLIINDTSYNNICIMEDRREWYDHICIIKYNGVRLTWIVRGSEPVRPRLGPGVCHLEQGLESSCIICFLLYRSHLTCLHYLPYFYHTFYNDLCTIKDMGELG